MLFNFLKLESYAKNHCGVSSKIYQLADSLVGYTFNFIESQELETIWLTKGLI